MEKILAMEQEVKKLIEEDRKRLLTLGYTQEDLQQLDNVLSYTAYPIIRNHFNFLYDNDND